MLENLHEIKEAIEAINGTKVTSANIWKGMQKNPIRLQVCQFLYLSTHQAYMIGNVWSNIPDFVD